MLNTPPRSTRHSAVVCVSAEIVQLPASRSDLFPSTAWSIPQYGCGYTCQVDLLKAIFSVNKMFGTIHFYIESLQKSTIWIAYDKSCVMIHFNFACLEFPLKKSNTALHMNNTVFSCEARSDVNKFSIFFSTSLESATEYWVPNKLKDVETQYISIWYDEKRKCTNMGTFCPKSINFIPEKLV